MDIPRFLAELDDAFSGDPQHTDAIDPRWQEIVGSVGGFTSANELAVLNLAARLLPEGEVYLEVGTFKGRSLCGAVQDNAGTTFHAIENYLEFGMLGLEARQELHRNLQTWAADADVRLREADCFRVMAEPSEFSGPVGVYFYDGAHTHLSHWLALGVVEPLLADEALVLVDDASWPMVQRAHGRYLRRHPGWEVVATWDAAVTDDPRWANGLHALAFRRPSGASRRLHRDVRVLRRVQLHLFAPVERLLWKTVHRFPGVVPLLKRMIPTRSRSVE